MDPFLSYIAGFFDGEGSIGIYRGSAGGRTLRVQLTQTITPQSTALLTLCRARWGGSMCEFNKALRRSAWNYQVSAGRGVILLREIRPWLRLKADQADIALAWWDGRPTVRLRDSRGRVLPSAPEVVVADALAELALKAAKQPLEGPS